MSTNRRKEVDFDKIIDAAFDLDEEHPYLSQTVEPPPKEPRKRKGEQGRK